MARGDCAVGVVRVASGGGAAASALSCGTGGSTFTLCNGGLLCSVGGAGGRFIVSTRFQAERFERTASRAPRPRSLWQQTGSLLTDAKDDGRRAWCVCAPDPSRAGRSWGALRAARTFCSS